MLLLSVSVLGTAATATFFVHRNWSCCCT